jgi:hypothetical protein
MLIKNYQRIGALYSIYLPGQFVYIDPYLYSRFRVQSTSPVRFGDINKFNPSIRLRDRLNRSIQLGMISGVRNAIPLF